MKKQLAEVFAAAAAIPAGVAEPETETHVRDFKIMKTDLEKHGFTIGCPGCDAAREYKQQRPHNPACREIIKSILLSSKVVSVLVLYHSDLQMTAVL